MKQQVLAHAAVVAVQLIALLAREVALPAAQIAGQQAVVGWNVIMALVARNTAQRKTTILVVVKLLAVHLTVATIMAVLEHAQVITAKTLL